MNIIQKIEGRAIVVRGNDIDTDQIIPARFLKAITFEGIEEYAFYDLRYTEDMQKKDHPFNDERYKGARVLLVNSNFGCGSSREHAPQTLHRHGIDVIIGESFAEIFTSNCTALGMPILLLPKAQIQELQQTIEDNPTLDLRIDIEQKKVHCEDKVYEVDIASEIRKTFLKGTWDNTNLMVSHGSQIEETYASIPYLSQFKGYE